MPPIGTLLRKLALAVVAAVFLVYYAASLWFVVIPDFLRSLPVLALYLAVMAGLLGVIYFWAGVFWVLRQIPRGLAAILDRSKGR